MELNGTVKFFLAQIISGVAYGSIYGLLALSIVFLYRANRLFNLATTEIATFFSILMFILLKQMNYFLAFAITIIAAFIGGVILHIGLMRVLTERRRSIHVNETVVTIGIFTILNSLSSMLNDEAEKFPTPFSDSKISFFGITVPFHYLVILGFALLINGILFLFLKYTQMGLVIEATAENNIAARLKGIKTSNVLAVSWGITTVISVIAGVLIAPILFLSTAMLTHVFAYSMIAVVLGGMESLMGAMIGGILIGVIENLASNIQFIGSDLKFGAVLFVLVIILTAKPRGLWGRAEHRKV